MTIKCIHRFIPIGPQWKFGLEVIEINDVKTSTGKKVVGYSVRYKKNFYKQTYMCHFCSKEKADKPYYMIGRKKFDISEEEYKKFKREAKNEERNLPRLR